MKTVDAFFRSAPQYYSEGDLLSRRENTLSLDAAGRVIEAITNQSTSVRTVCDIAGGTGYFSILLSRNIEAARCVVLDKSASMLSVGAAYLRNRPEHAWVTFVQGDAHRLPLNDHRIDCALVFCAMHLLDVEASLQEARRTLSDRGCIYILTWKPSDLARTIYHRFFPGYADFDLPRYEFADDLPRTLAGHGLRLVDTLKVDSRLEYETPQEAVALARSRPFSTFHFYSPQAFEAGLSEYSSALTREFGRGPVINSTSMTLFIASKQI